MSPSLHIASCDRSIAPFVLRCHSYRLLYLELLLYGGFIPFFIRAS